MKILFCFCLAILSNLVVAQKNQLKLDYHKSLVGHNIRLGVNHYLTNYFSVGGGIKYLQWQYTNNNPDGFTNRFKPANFWEHWGAYAHMQAHFLNPNYTLRPYFYYDAQITHASYNLDFYFNEGLFPVNGDTIPLFTNLNPHFNAGTTLEQSLGFGLDIKLTEHWSLTQRVGVSYVWYVKLPTATHDILIAEPFEYARMFSTSLVYSFRKKQAPKP
jgi:hypothetical protein